MAGAIVRAMQEPTIEDVDVLFGAATPHFAYQIRQRIQRLVAALPSDHPVKVHAAERLARLDTLGHTTSKAESGDPSAPHRE
jgi:hypothetical protein